MQAIFALIFLFFVAPSSSVTLNTVGRCLSDLVTQEYSNSYNYLQFSSKLGTSDAYPGFSSLFIKLSDDDSSKAHDVVKLLTVRKIKLDRLINRNGVSIRETSEEHFGVQQGLTEARHQSKETLDIVQRCHQEAANANDANIQDYLEAEILPHHIRIDKLLSDLQRRILDAPASDKQLTVFLVDDELLHTYGDRRQEIFS